MKKLPVLPNARAVDSVGVFSPKRGPNKIVRNRKVSGNPSFFMSRITEERGDDGMILAEEYNHACDVMRGKK